MFKFTSKEAISLIFWGTGGFLAFSSPIFKKNQVANGFFENQTKSLYLLDNFDQVNAFWSGLVRIGYNYYLLPRSGPAFSDLCGNVVRFDKKEENSILNHPSRFKKLTSKPKKTTKNWKKPIIFEPRPPYEKPFHLPTTD